MPVGSRCRALAACLVAVGVVAACTSESTSVPITAAGQVSSLSTTITATVTTQISATTNTPISTSIVPTDTAVPTASATPTVPPVVPEGFGQVAAQVTMADGTVCDLCLWLADTDEQRQQGLMFVTDLGGADGMAFRYPTARTGAFWMKNTVMRLSIGFYGADGAFLGAFDMEPCTADPCPTYPTPPDFMIAIETTQGGLPALGIEPGSTLTMTDLPCG